MLLVRGEETILISPNSVVGLPTEKKDGLRPPSSSRRLDPARGREAQRQAFRGRDAVSRRRGQGHAVQRHRERRQHQVDVLRGQVEVSDFKIRPDRAGDAGAGRHRLRARQARPLPERLRAPSIRSSRQAARLDDRARPRAEIAACPHRATRRTAMRSMRSVRSTRGTKAAGAPTQSHQAAGGQAPKGWRRAHLQFARRGQAERPQGHERARPRRRDNGARAQRERQHRDRDGLERLRKRARDHGRQQLQRHGGYGEQQRNRGSATSTSSNTTTTVATTAGSTSDVSGGSSGSGSNGTGTTNNGSGGTGNNGSNGNGNNGQPVTAITATTVTATMATTMAGNGAKAIARTVSSG